MQPAKKRLRSYDHERTRAALLAQFEHAREAVRALAPDQYTLPTGLGTWTVRELAAHLTMAVEVVNSALEVPEPVGPAVPLLDWPFGTASRASTIADRVDALAAAREPEELFTTVAERAERLLPGASGDRLLVTSSGPMRLTDYLVTRIVELVVHTDDLNRAAGLSVPFDRQALATATRLLADALAVRAPGASTEVRVPPYAVVQCVEGPRHTRGTPPNVVEAGPLVWLRLATGRTTWGEALAAAEVSASGERADLSGLLPLMG
ncbi:maleylpyruvate isomerase family mycothiol-dependent enzyme [Streptomyces sp. NRRL F-5126]|uniref:maleylpyruvate isomerase family mycothiol-dependent enzyme n=1 Tax=Streptomyces sp. NRRL F-5126 TaxID=1463857 RepID=UPI0004C80E73|nr:maleylpyruvate isomerase family mycothiol-dependent enzyme [Streptomyces sp. NRRL F-5126]